MIQEGEIRGMEKREGRHWKSCIGKGSAVCGAVHPRVPVRDEALASPVHWGGKPIGRQLISLCVLI